MQLRVLNEQHDQLVWKKNNFSYLEIDEDSVIDVSDKICSSDKYLSPTPLEVDFIMNSAC